jgi:hypothetical protein
MGHEIPITIEGGSVKIEFPNDLEIVYRDTKRRSITYVERDPHARIHRIAVTDARGQVRFRWEPKSGKCKIEVWYDHPEGAPPRPRPRKAQKTVRKQAKPSR